MPLIGIPGKPGFLSHPRVILIKKFSKKKKRKAAFF